jgi:UDP-N-acetylmuramate--alanine ligase
VPAGCRVITYGLHSPATLRAGNLHRNQAGGFTFQVTIGVQTCELALQVPGEHNVRNALAAFAVAQEMGLDLQTAASALAGFAGTGRRFDLRGEVNDIVIIDDYAHHPTEIRATLAAARSRYPERRIWAVWQPHTYSRTQTWLSDFAQAFNDADRVIVTAIYAAREQDNGFSASQVVEKMQPAKSRYIPALAGVRDTLLTELKPGDVVLVLSAGDADQISAQVLDALRKKEGHHA